MKRILSVLLCLLLLFVLSGVVLADDTVYTEGTLYYTIDNESITIVGCFGRDEEVTVPSSIAGIPVNTIAEGAFSGNRYVKKLNLPDTITALEDNIGDNVTVVYDANTSHPSLEPTPFILGTAPVGVPSSQDKEPEEPEGSGVLIVPGDHPEGEEEIGEQDVDLDELESDRSEKPAYEQPSDGQPAPENTSDGNAAGGKTSDDGSPAGSAADGDPADGQTAAVQSKDGNTSDGKTASEKETSKPSVGKETGKTGKDTGDARCGWLIGIVVAAIGAALGLLLWKRNAASKSKQKKD